MKKLWMGIWFNLMAQIQSTNFHLKDCCLLTSPKNTFGLTVGWKTPTPPTGNRSIRFSMPRKTPHTVRQLQMSRAPYGAIDRVDGSVTAHRLQGQTAALTTCSCKSNPQDLHFCVSVLTRSTKAQVIPLRSLHSSDFASRPSKADRGRKPAQRKQEKLVDVLNLYFLMETLTKSTNVLVLWSNSHRGVAKFNFTLLLTNYKKSMGNQISWRETHWWGTLTERTSQQPSKTLTFGQNKPNYTYLPSTGF